MAQNTQFVQRNPLPDEESPQAISQPQVRSAQWMSKSNRNQTNLNDEEAIALRPFKHAHIFRRPQAMQHYNSGNINASYGSLSTRTKSNDSREGREGRKSDNILVQLSRIDLFIDLVWVGIVANLSSNFGEQSFTNSGITTGQAIGEYILLFLPVWRLWDNLREFGSDFYKDDVLQRLFMCWILVLSVLYGINAPYAYAPEGENSLKLLIAIYLTARASFLAAYGIQAAFLPYLRRHFLFSAVCTILSSSLWIAAIYVRYPGKIALLIMANAMEQPIAVFLASPASDKILLTDGWEKNVDHEHFIERVEGFFIIILGEGVFRLVEGSPSGMGLNHRTGTALTALLLYYVLHWIYFNGDQSREYIHALKRRWWKSVLWKSFHLILFGALLLLAASVLFIVEHSVITNTVSTPEVIVEGTANEDSASRNTEEVVIYIQRALWSASGSLAIAVCAMTAIATLNRSLDKPKTLIINNRWLRLVARVPAIVIICSLPLFTEKVATYWCAGATSTLYAVFLYEWVAGMEKNWRVVEPRVEG